MPSLLLITIFLPALGAVALLLLDPKATAARARWVALLVSVATFLVSWGLAAQYMALPPVPSSERGPVHPQLVLRQTWLDLSQAGPHSPGVKLEFFLGLDGISVALVLLTTILTISSVLVSWTAIRERAAEFYACLLILETGLVGVFCSFDIILFYVFFEFTLIPLFFLVGIWGGPLRRYAAGKFFVYTLGGSLITLLGLVSMVVAAVRDNPTLTTPFSIPDLAQTLSQHQLPAAVQTTLFLMIAAGFMVKVPLFPFHTWLPLAHVEAPTAGSVLLAGVLLKLGTYGFLRMLLPMLPYACLNTGLPLIGTMASIGILYGSFCALSQNDIKKLVAYSSVAHLGFCMLGLFALNEEGISGGVLQMINHGLSTGALFCIVGMFYERYHTRQLNELGGIATKLPLMAVAMVFTSFASIGLPGLNGFVGEFLCLAGMFKAGDGIGAIFATMGALGVVIGAWYLLGVVQHAFFGKVHLPAEDHGHGHHHAHEPVADLNAREIAALAPLLGLCLLLGLFPQPLLNLIRPDVQAIVSVQLNSDFKTPIKVSNSVTNASLTQPPGVAPGSEVQP